MDGKLRFQAPNQDAHFIASVCLFSTGHWIGGAVLLVIFLASTQL